MNDHRRCPHCGNDIGGEYLMSRRAAENVMSGWTIAWVIAFVLLLLVMVNA